jgi:hypothetical protein
LPNEYLRDENNYWATQHIKKRMFLWLVFALRTILINLLYFTVLYCIVLYF